MGYYSDPDNANFGFVLNSEDGNLRTFTGPEYLKLRDDPERQEELEVKIYADVSVYVTEITDASSRSTGEIGLISEIYCP